MITDLLYARQKVAKIERELARLRERRFGGLTQPRRLHGPAPAHTARSARGTRPLAPVMRLMGLL